MVIKIVDEGETVQNEFLQSNGQANFPFTRDIQVGKNEEGYWERLSNELTEISNEYGVEFDYAIELF